MSFLLPKPPSRVKEKHDKDWLKQRSWQLVRLVVLRRDNYECRAKDQGVGACIGPLDVHHWRPRSIGGQDVPHALITLCRGHHAEMHAWRLFADAKTKHGADGQLTWSTK